MPALKVTLSATLTKEQKTELACSLSSAVAALLSKPEQYVQVMITDDAVVSFAGKKAADSAFAVLLSIGGFSPGSQKKLSAGLADIFVRFGIAKEHLYLVFTSVAAENWGWNGTTFA